jgi:hypothetical protein
MCSVSDNGVWRPVAGASEAALEALVAAAPIELPASYLDQLRSSNGGEGSLGVDPGWIMFWPAAEVMCNNRGYLVQKRFPGFFGFASNGGGELIVFDIRNGSPYLIAMVPFIIMAMEDLVPIADDFDDLRCLIGHDWEDTD